MEKPALTRSISAQRAAQCVILAANSNGMLDSAVAVSPEFADAEKELIVKILGEIKTHLETTGTRISADEISSLFNFVFAKSAEVVTNFANHRPNEFTMLGLWDGKAPIAAEELLIGHFKQSTFATDCARNFWEMITGANPPEPDEALLCFGEALKWCFRLSCHYAVMVLEHHNYRFI